MRMSQMHSLLSLPELQNGYLRRPVVGRRRTTWLRISIACARAGFWPLWSRCGCHKYKYFCPWSPKPAVWRTSWWCRRGGSGCPPVDVPASASQCRRCAVSQSLTPLPPRWSSWSTKWRSPCPACRIAWSPCKCLRPTCTPRSSNPHKVSSPATSQADLGRSRPAAKAHRVPWKGFSESPSGAAEFFNSNDQR